MDDAVQQETVREDVVQRRTPVHLWIVGILALIWNAIGCYDYLMTRQRNTDYLASMMPTVDPNAVLAWIDAFPVWAQFGWGLGVWGGLAGAILLLLRSQWAMWVLGLSLVGAILGLGYQIVAAPPLPGMEGPMADIMPWVIILIAALLFLYASAMRQKGVLR
jgi:hypothetical protein